MVRHQNHKIGVSATVVGSICQMSECYDNSNSQIPGFETYMSHFHLVKWATGLIDSYFIIHGALGLTGNASLIDGPMYRYWQLALI